MYVLKYRGDEYYFRVMSEIAYFLNSRYGSSVSMNLISKKINGDYVIPRRVHEKTKILYDVSIDRVEYSDELYRKYREQVFN